jgi:8-amino-7-oxononanoate synthase
MMGDLTSGLAALGAKGLLRRRRTLESAQGVRVIVDGRAFLSFASNDYLGLAADPRLVAAICEAGRRHGVGAGASHLVTGHHREHDLLEQDLAAFVGLPRVLFFSSGYLANLAVVTTLAGPGSRIFADRLNHASLIDAMLLSRQRFSRYRHADACALESGLAGSKAGTQVVVTDSVFSMDGDIAPLGEIAALCRHHGAWLVVDDAHGFGVVGDAGLGTLDHVGRETGRLAYVGTLGKAAGVSGAFVAGSAELVDTLLQRARSYLYTTATPPALAAALRVSIALMRKETWRRERLQERVSQINGSLQLRRWRKLPSTSAIHPVIIGGNDEAVAAADLLAAEGILVPAIRPPTVPARSARLRICLSASHSSADVRQLVEALQRAEAALS